MKRPAQATLFETEPRLPEGFVYVRDFITPESEARLLVVIRDLPLAEAQYKEFTAKRRTVHYGSEYDFSRNALEAAPGIPAFLGELRNQAAHWMGIQPDEFVHALVSEYRPGTPLGWHRDVPNFDLIFGVSLGGSCRMRLRPYRPGHKNRREDVIVLDLEPRSAYQMRGAARWGWQHSIVETKALRHSITFRTARRQSRPGLSGGKEGIPSPSVGER